MRTVTPVQRRRSIARQHHLAGDAHDVEAVVQALGALHATDPASVYLAVLARCESATIADVAAAMYERRSLVRWLAMRRTLFVFTTADVPMVQAAASSGVAAALRTRLANQLARNGADPALEAEPLRWVDDTADLVEAALARLGSATGAEISAQVPSLLTSIVPRAVSDRPQKVTSSLLAMVSAQGRAVRATPVGSWTGRQHRWEPVSAWWPEGMPHVPVVEAQRELARVYLSRFGPATVDDLQWWTGWSKTTTRRALTGVPTVGIDLHGEPGLALDDWYPTTDAMQPVASLLPSLDPTAMGWRHRDWYQAVDPALVYDRAGNIGPTVWWDGEIIGSWAVAATGEVRVGCPVDRGAVASAAVHAAAARLQRRLDGAVVTPAVRTPLERSLVSDR